MNFFLKAIIIFYFFHIIAACTTYISGGIRIIPAKNKDFLNYKISNKDLFVEGKIEGKLYRGKLYTVKEAQKIEIKRYSKVSKKYIRATNIFAFTKLQDNTGKYFIECFIKQKSNRKFYHGGIGRCYMMDNRYFDILLENRTMPFLPWIINIQ